MKHFTIKDVNLEKAANIFLWMIRYFELGVSIKLGK